MKKTDDDILRDAIKKAQEMGRKENERQREKLGNFNWRFGLLILSIFLAAGSAILGRDSFLLWVAMYLLILLIAWQVLNQ